MTCFFENAPVSLVTLITNMTALSPMDSMVTTSHALYCIIKYQFFSNPDHRYDGTQPDGLDGDNILCTVLYQ